MAHNVFGKSITESTLEEMAEYVGKTITRLDMARVALNMKNTEEQEKARQYVKYLKETWGTGVSTLCLIYNATGGPVNYVTSHDWYGHIGPGPYPITIENGQWGGYMHVKTSGAATGSSAAVVYRGRDENGYKNDWMAAWSNPWNRSSSNNTAYTEIREFRLYEKSDDEYAIKYKEFNPWDDLSTSLYNSNLNHSHDWEGCFSTVTTTSNTTAEFEATLTLSKAR